MNIQFDAVTQTGGQHAPRRRVVQGLGVLALGALGLASFTGAEAAKSCRDKCKRDNCGTLTPDKCSQRCQQRCRN